MLPLELQLFKFIEVTVRANCMNGSQDVQDRPFNSLRVYLPKYSPKKGHSRPVTLIP